MSILTPAQWRWIAYALLLASAIPLGLCIPQFRKARSAPYYVIRQNALKRGTRCMLVAAALLALALILLMTAPYLAATVRIPTPVPTMTPTYTPMPTYTPRPTHTPTTAPTRGPTATAPLIPTPTPTPAPTVPIPESALTPLPSAVPAGEGARFELVDLSTQVRGGRPVDPGNTFPPGDHRVYVFFHYQGMQNGVMATLAWYRDGEFIGFCSDTWLWGLNEDYEFGGATGDSLVYCKPPGGWKSGNYEIHAFIETRLQSIVQFVITEQPAEEPSPTPTLTPTEQSP